MDEIGVGYCLSIWGMTTSLNYSRVAVFIMNGALQCRWIRRSVLTHWSLDKRAAIFQTAFWNGFSSMKMYEYRLKFHWSLFLCVKLTIFRHWFRKCLGAGQATSHFLNQWRLVCWRIYASLGLSELTKFTCVLVVNYLCRHNAWCEKQM